jgi:hypothetical protein
MAEDKRATWRRLTLGEAAELGNPIVVWCNDKACGYWLEHGRQYRAVLTAADLAAYAERYGEAVTFEDFRARLRCRYCGSGDVSTIVDTLRWSDRTRLRGENAPSVQLAAAYDRSSRGAIKGDRGPIALS